ncbi:helix-turn-helix domain-containing protein [Lentisalinibacter salinarum]|uniref:helix-turn-helix domain-containing protein n=1 Tax=Lentisalinibacter salinarum TaxID=2992239 RepID=UPI003865C389
MRQEEIVIRHLKETGWLTGRAAFDLYRIQDLPKRVSVLKREGHNIERFLKTDEEGRRYAVYRLGRAE